MMAKLRRTPVLEVGILAVGSAAALGLVDVIFVCQRRIRPVYLLDAAVEAVLVLLWLLVGLRGLR